MIGHKQTRLTACGLILEDQGQVHHKRRLEQNCQVVFNRADERITARPIVILPARIAKGAFNADTGMAPIFLNFFSLGGCRALSLMTTTAFVGF